MLTSGVMGCFLLLLLFSIHEPIMAQSQCDRSVSQGSPFWTLKMFCHPSKTYVSIITYPNPFWIFCCSSLLQKSSPQTCARHKMLCILFFLHHPCSYFQYLSFGFCSTHAFCSILSSSLFEMMEVSEVLGSYIHGIPFI